MQMANLNRQCYSDLTRTELLYSHERIKDYFKKLSKKNLERLLLLVPQYMGNMAPKRITYKEVI
jgi:hypothetical protein